MAASYTREQNFRRRWHGRNHILYPTLSLRLSESTAWAAVNEWQFYLYANSNGRNVRTWWDPGVTKWTLPCRDLWLSFPRYRLYMSTINASSIMSTTFLYPVLRYFRIHKAMNSMYHVSYLCHLSALECIVRSPNKVVHGIRTLFSFLFFCFTRICYEFS